jgi:hypothetical protein
MSKYRIVKVETNRLDTANIGTLDAEYYLTPEVYYEVQEKITFLSGWETLKKCRSEKDARVFIDFTKNKEIKTIIK